ncbi:MAG: beta-ketoacyl synthase N-terminal-like domain-containing protein [Phycisphaerales bacterium]
MAHAQESASDLWIVGAGAQTPVGRYVLAAAAAVRCGISAYAEHPFMIDKHGEPMVVARADWLDETLPLADRIVTLAVDAAQEALHPIATQLPALRREMRVHLALSAENLPDPAQRQIVLDRFAAGAGFTPADPPIEPVADGHAGGLLALENACRQLRRGEASLCLVGGTDSWLGPERLEAIDLAGRLHSVNYSWGFTPGEGAGFCLVTTGAMARRLGLPPLAELLAVATAQETKLMGTKTVCIGEGLTAAFRGVLNPSHPVSHSYCDFNGETYRADEYGFTICRTRERFEDPGSFTAAAECWGDVGAASGPLAITLPLAAWSRGYAKGPVTLAWSSSARAPLRAAALLKQPAASLD